MNFLKDPDMTTFEKVGAVLLVLSFPIGVALGAVLLVVFG